MSFTSFDMPGLDAPPAQGWGGKENQVFARFYKGQKLDGAASQEAGRPVHKAVDMVEIRQLGEKDSVIHEVNELYKQKYARAWQAYSAGMEQIADGTPLALLFPANPEVVETLKGYHVYTVEALVKIPDSTVSIPFLSDFKKKAEAYLDTAEKGKGYHALEAKLEAAELKNIENEDLIKTLSERLTALEKKGKSRNEPEQE